MRNVRVRRRRMIDIGNIGLGDWIIVAAGALTVVSLFLPWFRSSVPPHSEWAFTYSEVASVFVIVFFLASLFLVVYPSLSPDLGLPPLPFATPPLFFLMGGILLLIFTYELGKYACISCPSGSRGYGLWVALIAAVVYLAGSVIKWGSRATTQRA